MAAGKTIWMFLLTCLLSEISADQKAVARKFIANDERSHEVLSTPKPETSAYRRVPMTSTHPVPTYTGLKCGDQEPTIADDILPNIDVKSEIRNFLARPVERLNNADNVKLPLALPSVTTSNYQPLDGARTPAKPTVPTVREVNAGKPELFKDKPIETKPPKDSCNDMPFGELRPLVGIRNTKELIVPFNEKGNSSDKQFKVPMPFIRKRNLKEKEDFYNRAIPEKFTKELFAPFDKRADSNAKETHEVPLTPLAEPINEKLVLQSGFISERNAKELSAIFDETKSNAKKAYEHAGRNFGEATPSHFGKPESHRGESIKNVLQRGNGNDGHFKELLPLTARRNTGEELVPSESAIAERNAKELSVIFDEAKANAKKAHQLAGFDSGKESTLSHFSKMEPLRLTIMKPKIPEDVNDNKPFGALMSHKPIPVRNLNELSTTLDKDGNPIVKETQEMTGFDSGKEATFSHSGKTEPVRFRIMKPKSPENINNNRPFEGLEPLRGREMDTKEKMVSYHHAIAERNTKQRFVPLERSAKSTDKETREPPETDTGKEASFRKTKTSKRRRGLRGLNRKKRNNGVSSSRNKKSVSRNGKLRRGRVMKGRALCVNEYCDYMIDCLKRDVDLCVAACKDKGNDATTCADECNADCDAHYKR